MTMRQLAVEVFDDGQTVCINVHKFETVGAVIVGPIPVICHHHTLSYPTDPDQWIKDTVVQVLELL